MQKIARVNNGGKEISTSESQNKQTMRGKGESVNKFANKVLFVRKSNNNGREPTASLSDTRLLGSGSAGKSHKQEGSKILHSFLNAVNNDELELTLTESGQNFLLSVKPFQIKFDQEMLRNTYFELVQHEVNHLREKFELNNRHYQMDDLLRLTENSKKILSYGAAERHIDYDERVIYIYFNQERRRIEIERKIGLALFLRAYERMIAILNGHFYSNLKHSLEHKSFNIAGDTNDIIKKKWIEIISILDDKQEYLPDIWELAMSEYMFYHM